MGFEGNWAFAVSAAVDALVVCGLVVWAVRTRPGWLRLALACGLVLVFLALKGVVLVASGLDIPFGVMHVLWLDLVVVLPLAAELLGVLTWRTGSTALRVLVVLGLVLHSKTDVIADGLLLGGVFTLLYSIIRSFGSEDPRYSFLVTSAGLVITMVVGYFKFLKHQTAKAKK